MCGMVLVLIYLFIDWLNIVHKICLKNYLLTVQLLPQKLWIIKQCSNLVEIPKLADLDWMNYPHITEIITEIITIIITIIFITIFKIREELINRAKVVQYFMKAISSWNLPSKDPHFLNSPCLTRTDTQGCDASLADAKLSPFNDITLFDTKSYKLKCPLHRYRPQWLS